MTGGSWKGSLEANHNPLYGRVVLIEWFVTIRHEIGLRKAVTTSSFFVFAPISVNLRYVHYVCKPLRSQLFCKLMTWLLIFFLSRVCNCNIVKLFVRSIHLSFNNIYLKITIEWSAKNKQECLSPLCHVTPNTVIVINTNVCRCNIIIFKGWIKN